MFCRRCTAPVQVVSLSDFSDDELARCAAALLQVLSDITRDPPQRRLGIDVDLWRAYLSAFWLRPETAMVLYGEAAAIRSLPALPQGPWMDLGCGDGIHAALYSGWRFAGSFDAFQSLDPAAKDVYNHWNSDSFRVEVAQPGAPRRLGHRHQTHRCRSCSSAGRLPECRSGGRRASARS